MRGKGKSAAKSAAKSAVSFHRCPAPTWPRRLRPCSSDDRPSRTTQEKRKQPCGDSESEGPETESDGEWSGEDDPLSDHGREDEDEEEETVLKRKHPLSVQCPWLIVVDYMHMHMHMHMCMCMHM